MMQEKRPNKDSKKTLSYLRHLATKAYGISGRISDRNNHGIIVFNANLEIIYLNKTALDILNISDLSNFDIASLPKLFDRDKEIGDKIFIKARTNPNSPIKLPIMGNLLFNDGFRIAVKGAVEYNTNLSDELGYIYEMDLYNAEISDANLFNSTIHVYPYFYDVSSQCFHFPFILPPFLQAYKDKFFVTTLDLLQYLHPKDVNKVIPSMDEVNKLDLSDSYYTSSWRMKGLDGSYSWYETRFVRTLIPGKKDKFTMGCLIESNDAYNRINRLRKTSRESEKTVDMQQNFLATMSHDLRTPLNSIIGFTDIITTEKLEDDEKVKYSKIIQQNSKMLLSLVNDILDLSKIQAGTLRIAPQIVNVVSLFENLKLTMREKLSNLDVDMRFHNPYEKLNVFIDGNRFLQVMNNLMTNAIKYTIEGTIDVTLSYDNNKLKFEVIDTGIGIPYEKQKFVFKPFQKLDNFAKGNGLGLSIVAKIIDLMRGEYGFDSKKDEGSTFWVVFPVIFEDAKLIKEH